MAASARKSAVCDTLNRKSKGNRIYFYTEIVILKECSSQTAEAAIFMMIEVNV